MKKKIFVLSELVCVPSLQLYSFLRTLFFSLRIKQKCFPWALRLVDLEVMNKQLVFFTISVNLHLSILKSQQFVSHIMH